MAKAETNDEGLGYDPSNFHESSGNVFADLGVPDPELALAKSKLAYRIQQLIDARGLTQAQAATVMDIAQPQVSLIVRGRLRNVSIEKLMDLLLRFNQEIEITVRPAEHGARYIVTSPAAMTGD
jgi:predicted XRE-type DNA-binding protein